LYLIIYSVTLFKILTDVTIYLSYNIYVKSNLNKKLFLPISYIYIYIYIYVPNHVCRHLVSTQRSTQNIFEAKPIIIVERKDKKKVRLFEQKLVG
jgi:hypothetical protein